MKKLLMKMIKDFELDWKESTNSWKILSKFFNLMIKIVS
jgi:hypothetical protein